MNFWSIIFSSVALLHKANIAHIGALSVFGVFVALVEFLTLICLPLGLDLYLETGIFSNINTVKIPAIIEKILLEYNLIILCSLVLFLSSLKLIYTFLLNHFSANLAASFGEEFVNLYLRAKREVTKNDDSVVMARIFFGDVQIWSSDFCQKIITIFERMLFLLISLVYFILYLPVYSVSLVAFFGIISLIFIKLIQSKNEEVGGLLKHYSDKLMVSGEKISDGALEIKSSKNIEFFARLYFIAYKSFAKQRSLAAVLKNIPGIVTTGAGQFALVLTPVMLVNLSYEKSDVTAAFIILGIVLSRAIPVIGSISTDLTIIFNNLPTLERVVSCVNKYSEFQECHIWNNRNLPVTQRMNSELNRIAISDLGLKYGENNVLNSVNLSLVSGNVYGVSGLSGAGKTSLCFLISGLLEPSAGKVSYIDKSGRLFSPEISISPQKAVIFDGSFSLNIFMGNTTENANFEEFIDTLSLKKIRDNWPSDLNSTQSVNTFFSGGELQRIAILRALMKDADIYIFDEPTSSLDRERASNFFSILRKYYNDKLVIIITHSKQEILWCDYNISVENQGVTLSKC